MDLELTGKVCVDCRPGTAKLGEDRVAELMPALDPGWRRDGGTLRRRFELKGYAPGVLLANAVAFLGEREGHHADVAFGWNYCEVMLTTHVAHGLTENDFIVAAKLDALVAVP